jgi:hypothetical protein
MSSNWVEYAKLAVSALIPVAVVYVGLRLESAKTVNQELINARLKYTVTLHRRPTTSLCSLVALVIGQS